MGMAQAVYRRIGRASAGGRMERRFGTENEGQPGIPKRRPSLKFQMSPAKADDFIPELALGTEPGQQVAQEPRDDREQGGLARGQIQRNQQLRAVTEFLPPTGTPLPARHPQTLPLDTHGPD